MKTKNLLALLVAWTLLFWVTSATSSYIHEQNGTISICDPDSNWTKCITMQDKNLWADVAWTWTSSYWNHYQRWNNHEFEIWCWTNNCSDTVTNSATTGKATWDNSYNNYWYNGWITNFMKWSSDYRENNSQYDWLWWWANDSQANNWWYDEENNVAINVENRQWPCGEWYHVPSIWEWNQVLEYIGQNNNIDERLFSYSDDGLLYLNKCAEWVDVVCYSNDNDEQVDCSNENIYYDCENWEYDETFWLKIQEDFKIPFAGLRDYDAYVNDVGSSALLWSSSPIVGLGGARYFFLDPNEANTNSYFSRANAYSVRCFKDSYLEFPSSESGASTGQVSLTLTEWQNTCTLQDYNLWTHSVSQEDQEVQSENQEIVCEFLQNTWVIVTMSMSNLSAWESEAQKIWANNFTWIVLSWDYAWSIEDLTPWNYNLSWSHTIYTKEENKIWIWTWSLQIEWIIPAWTPSGSYTWALDIIIQAWA